MTIRALDILERTFWTAVAAALVAVPSVAVLDVEAWKAAAGAAATSVVTSVLAIARWRLSVLPDPGTAVAEGVAHEVYRQIEVGGGQ